MPRAKKTTTPTEIKPAVMPEKKYGIEELSDVVLLITSFTYALSKSRGTNGKYWWKDSFKYIGAFKRLPEAIRSIDQVPNEIKDLDEQELEALRKLIEKNFQLSDKDKEKRIEEALDIAFRIIGAVQNMFA